MPDFKLDNSPSTTLPRAPPSVLVAEMVTQSPLGVLILPPCSAHWGAPSLCSPSPSVVGPLLSWLTQFQISPCSSSPISPFLPESRDRVPPFGFSCVGKRWTVSVATRRVSIPSLDVSGSLLSSPPPFTSVRLFHIQISLHPLFRPYFRLDLCFPPFSSL